MPHGRAIVEQRIRHPAHAIKQPDLHSPAIGNRAGDRHPLHVHVPQLPAIPPLAVGLDVGEEVAGRVQHVVAGGDEPQATIGVQLVDTPDGDELPPRGCLRQHVAGQGQPGVAGPVDRLDRLRRRAGRPRPCPGEGQPRPVGEGQGVGRFVSQEWL